MSLLFWWDLLNPGSSRSLDWQRRLLLSLSPQQKIQLKKHQNLVWPFKKKNKKNHQKSTIDCKVLKEKTKQKKNKTWIMLTCTAIFLLSLLTRIEKLGVLKNLLVSLLSLWGNFQFPAVFQLKIHAHTASCPTMLLSTLVVTGTKEFFSLLVLHLGRACVWPDGSSLNSAERQWVQSAKK